MTVLHLVALERVRQEALRDRGVLRYTAADPDCPDLLRLAALVEEVGEVARAVHDGGNLEEELVQVAAVAVAWLEGLAERSAVMESNAEPLEGFEEASATKGKGSSA